LLFLRRRWRCSLRTPAGSSILPQTPLFGAGFDAKLPGTFRLGLQPCRA
jgi:hypothetical protein